MHKMISVIMPCYNAESTVVEAARSVLSQGDILSELILVNDGSNDGSQAKIDFIESLDPRVRTIVLTENRGGGFARNAGIEASKSDVILCFDSDDILPLGMLEKLYDRLLSGDFEGACFSRGESFQKSTRKSRPVSWGDPGSICALPDVFSRKKWPVGGIFLMKKSAWKTCDGFPTDNNFDTQGFGFRFLKKRLRAVVVEESWFYQRQFAKKESYFERAFISGEYSLGFLCNVLDLWEFLTDEARVCCLHFPFSTETDFDHNVMKELESLHSQDRLLRGASHEDELCHARHLELGRDWKLAYQEYERIWFSNPKSPFLEYLFLRAQLELREGRALRVHEVKEMVNRVFPQAKSKNPFHSTLSERVVRKWKKIFQKSAS